MSEQVMVSKDVANDLLWKDREILLVVDGEFYKFYSSEEEVDHDHGTKVITYVMLRESDSKLFFSRFYACTDIDLLNPCRFGNGWTNMKDSYVVFKEYYPAND